MFIRSVLAAGLAACFVASAGATGALSPFAGRWITESGNLEIEIAPCGEAWCGTVTRELGNRAMSAAGQAMKAVDARPALGMKILTALQPSGDGATLSGDIYNRENGKSYRVRLHVDEAHLLHVRPYVLLPLFGKTQVWQRAPVAQAGPPVPAPADPAASSGAR